MSQTQVAFCCRCGRRNSRTDRLRRLGPVSFRADAAIPGTKAARCTFRQVLETGAAPLYDERDIAARWLAWFAEQGPKSRIASQSPPSTKSSDTTVVVTHYERPRLVEQTLRALAVQTDRHFDVVLVDDGSKSDAAKAFLALRGRGMAGLSIKVVRQSNRYVGAARNEGVRHADGSFVIFLDDDNVPFPNRAEVFRRAAHVSPGRHRELPDAIPPGSGWRAQFESLINGERWGFPGSCLNPARLNPELFRRRDGYLQARPNSERIGGFHEIHGLALEDWQFHLRARLEGLNLLSLPLPLFWYRLTPDSMTRSTNYLANMRVVAPPFMPRCLGIYRR